MVPRCAHGLTARPNPTTPVAKRRTWSDVLAAPRQLADAAERFVPRFDEEAA